MASTSASNDQAARSRTRRSAWLLGLALAAGVAASLSMSYTLYRTAERQWIARAASDAQRLSNTLLGWMDESYAPLSGLAALVESSPRTGQEDFLNALDRIESRTSPVLLGAAGMLTRDSKGVLRLVSSSGNFVFLERDAAHGLA